MNALTGTGHLVRLVLRRDRVRLPLWVGGLTGLTVVSAAAVQDLYSTPVEIAAYRATVQDSASGRLLNGVPYAVDTVAGITAYEVTSIAGLVVALMVTFTVVRHTRGEEETGTAELLRSTVTGRHAGTAAALLVAIGAAFLAGALDAAVLWAIGLPGAGSLLHGAALAGVGLVFTASAAAAAQLTSSARGALGVAGAVLALLFVVRGVGAVRDDWLVWLSPFGWQDATRPYGDRLWWPLLLVVALTAVVAGGAAWLTAHRDFGSGLVPPRAGRARATAALGTPVGLAWRVQRGLFLGWAVGLTLFAALFGSLGREVVTLIESNPEMADVMGLSLDDVVRSYFAYVIPFLGVLASAYAVASALRLRSEELGGRAEAVLATGTSRLAWALGGVAVTVLGTLAMVVLMGVALSTSHLLLSGEDALFGRLVGATVQQAAPVLLVASTAFLAHGWFPHRALLAWAVFAFALLEAYLGELLSMPAWLADLSPFRHPAGVPVEPFTPWPLLVIGALAAAAVAVGLAGLRRRDLSSA
ncbi:ABC transporter permease [Nocardioides solisilvae]|uniref:ABC transporter permease n=1 Tax=Nocardioides solisilvae TaxID=1542435 RepID=UPI0013A53E9C|nr:hypothetical protein [Nocardioides solisilvae]